jgi:hypothetical protein
MTYNMEDNMDIQVFSLPTFTDDKLVEEVYCEFLNKYRNGETLNLEELDWMDSANTWLATCHG